MRAPIAGDVNKDTAFFGFSWRVYVCTLDGLQDLAARLVELDPALHFLNSITKSLPSVTMHAVPAKMRPHIEIT